MSKVALITAGGSGMGADSARALAEMDIKWVYCLHQGNLKR